MNRNWFNNKAESENFEQEIARKLKSIGTNSISDLHIDFYIQDQILFQTMKSSSYKERGLLIKSNAEYVAVHFFNKNKTLTSMYHEKVSEQGYLAYEDPKGVYFYLNKVGEEPNQIASNIIKELELYTEIDKSMISLVFSVY